MFGYLRPCKAPLPLSERKIYRDYYCSCCLALKENYGPAARLFLSYDIGYVALILFPRTLKLECCGQCGKQIRDVKSCFSQSYWKKVSLYQMTLVRMKLMDDMHDRKSRFARSCLQKLFSLCFRKAERDVAPYLHIFQEYWEKEQHFQSYQAAEAVYLTFMENVMEEVFGSVDEKMHLLLVLSKWIFFIDAVDDYDQDIQQGSCSLFCLDAPVYSSKRVFLREERECLLARYNQIHHDIVKAYSRCSFNRQQKIALNNLIFDSIPDVTEHILNGQKLIYEKLL